MLRIFGFFLTYYPGLYYAIVAYLIEMLPTPLSFYHRRAAEVPMPAAAEAFVMIIKFDVLRKQESVCSPNRQR
jgi:spore germination protein KA